MSDIDDDLLALAGLGSEEEEEIQSSDDDYEVKSKSSGSKRKIYDNEDEDEDGEEDEGEKDPYPLEGKFKDAKDRDELMAMDEMTREQILFDRVQELEKYRERKFLALRARQSRVENDLKDSASNKKKQLRTSKLSELKKQREKKSKGTAEKARRYESDEDEAEEDDDDAMSVDDEEEEDDYDEGYYSDVEDKRQRKRQQTEPGIDYSRLATVSDLNTIRVSRSTMSKYLYREEFPTVMQGTYVRLNIGASRDSNRNSYRMCKVEEVQIETKRPYKLGDKPCNIYMLVSQGSSKKLTDLVCVSDSPITEEEFAIYKKSIEGSEGSMPTIGDVDFKFRELKEMSTRKLTDEDINKMVAARDSVSAATMESGNRVRRLQILREELTVAVSKGDAEEIKKLQTQIDELNKYTNKNKQESSMTKVNLRNRRNNDSYIRKAELQAVEVRKLQSLSSNANADPFSRLRTTPKIFYSNVDNDDSKAATDSSDVSAEEATRLKAEKLGKERKSMIKSKYRKIGIDSVIKNIPFDIQIDI